MQKPVIRVVSLVSVVALIAWVLVMQNRREAMLQAKIDALEQELQARGGSGDELPAVEAEEPSRELLRLRSQVSLLRLENQELARKLDNGLRESTPTTNATNSVRAALAVVDKGTGMMPGASDNWGPPVPFTMASVVEPTGPKGSTRLHREAFRGETAIVKAMLRLGPNVNVLDDQQQTPLFKAVFAGDTDRYVETAQLLLQSGANPNLKDIDGVSPFQIAVQNNRTNMAQLLYRWGARE